MAEKKKTSETKEPIVTERLHRSKTHKIIAGVAGGFGEFFNIDPTIIRIIFIILTVFGGSGIIIYIVLWIVMPSESFTGEFGKEGIRGNVEEMKEQAKSFAHNFGHPTQDNNSRLWWAILIIILGFIFLLKNLGLLDGLDLGKFWPVILIIVGLIMITKKNHHS